MEPNNSVIKRLWCILWVIHNITHKVCLDAKVTKFITSFVTLSPHLLLTLDACLSADLDLATFFVEIDHEIFSVVIISLPLIKEGQL